MNLVVGTRGSKLSLIQTESVVEKLASLLPNLKIETRIIKTTGDKMPEEPLLSIKEKGIFEKELDKAVAEGTVDFAIHSMKDVPVQENLGVEIVAVPERDSPNDAFISKKHRKLAELPAGSLVGTGSPRRGAQLLHIRPDLKVKPVRGNVDTRLRKLDEGHYDALILAEAGLRRLGTNGYSVDPLALEEFTPSPGQGALAVVTRKSGKVAEVLKLVNHPPTMAEVLSERAFIRKMGGGCKVPVGAVARARVGELSLQAALFSPDGREKLQAGLVGRISAPEELGVGVAEKMRELGSESFIRRWRDSYV